MQNCMSETAKAFHGCLAFFLQFYFTCAGTEGLMPKAHARDFRVQKSPESNTDYPHRFFSFRWKTFRRKQTWLQTVLTALFTPRLLIDAVANETEKLTQLFISVFPNLFLPVTKNRTPTLDHCPQSPMNNNSFHRNAHLFRLHTQLKLKRE